MFQNFLKFLLAGQNSSKPVKPSSNSRAAHALCSLHMIRLFACLLDGVSRDKEAPGEDKKLDTAAEKDSEVVAAPAESRTVQLSKRVEAEGKMADARTKRMVDLNSELKRRVSSTLR